MAISTSNGVDIWYEVSGDGPALVLLHANPFDHQMWMYQIAHFSAFFKVVAIDLRGYGRSVKMTTEFDLRDMASDVRGVLRALKIDRAIIMGCSVGSALAILLGIEHPSLCEALILVGGSSDVSARFPRRIEGYLHDINSYHRKFMEDLVHPSFPKTEMGRYLIDSFVEKQHWLKAEAVAATLRATNSIVTTSRLHQIRAPTLVINGEVDNSRPAGELTASLIPGAVHRVIEGAGHACCIEDPICFDRLVTEFLKGRQLFPV